MTGCARGGAAFNDRCVTCGTSPRGRVADLTLASFVALGGELERGCFNATIDDWPLTMHPRRIGSTIREVGIPVLAVHAARRRARPSWPGRCGPARSMRRARPDAAVPVAAAAAGRALSCARWSSRSGSAWSRRAGARSGGAWSRAAADRGPARRDRCSSSSPRRALIELRRRRPDPGCGCFGDLSSARSGGRSSSLGLLAAAALARSADAAADLPPPGRRAALLLGILVRRARW